MKSSSDPRFLHPSRRGECEQCGETIDTTANGVARLGTGWIPNRSGGGPNAIVDVHYAAGRYLCRFCVDKRRQGLSWQQGRLFETRDFES